MKRTAYSVSVFFKEFRSYGILFLRFSFPFSSIYFQLPSSNLQNPSTSKFQTFLSPLPPPSNRLISSLPLSYIFSSSFPAFISISRHNFNRVFGRISLIIQPISQEVKRAKEWQRGIKRRKDEVGETRRRSRGEKGRKRSVRE